jgi:hypothetical protein
VEAASCAANALAFNDAIRNGGFSTSVPRVVDVSTLEVVLSDPQAVSARAATAALSCTRNPFMPASLTTAGERPQQEHDPGA